MLEQIFKTILSMSAVGSALIIILLCLKPVTKRLFSPVWQYYIWLTVLVVMLLPVHFNAPTHTPKLPVTNANQYDDIGAAVPAVQSDNTAVIENPLPQTDFLQEKTLQLPQNTLYYSANIWLFGMIAILLAKIIKYNLFLRAIHKASPIDADIPKPAKRLRARKTDMLDAPLIVGLFKPTLFLPNTEITKSNMNYILMHELTHYRRCDILYKWFTMLVVSVHWFNPFMYIVSRQIDTECEISCDYAVTSKLSHSEKDDYMRMILDLLATSKSSLRPLTTQMANGKNTLKRRFLMIKTKKSTSMIMSLISLLTAVIIFSTSVFASGVLNGLTDEDYTIDIQNNGEKIEFANKPFIENGKVYVPLRELLEKTGIMENPQSKIEWDNGKINVTMAYFDENDDTDLLYTVAMQIGKDGLTVKSAKVPGTQESFNDTLSGWDCTPILKNSITYIPHLYYGYVFMGRREIDYTIYGADKSVIDFSGYSHDFVGQYRIKVPNWWDSENYTLYKSPDGSTTYFAQRSSYDKYGAGTLFGISKVEAFAADEYLNMHKGSRLLYKNDEFSYIFIVPTDVQKPIWDGADDEDAETVKEYDKMYADVHKIADTFEYLGE